MADAGPLLPAEGAAAAGAPRPLVPPELAASIGDMPDFSEPGSPSKGGAFTVPSSPMGSPARQSRPKMKMPPPRGGKEGGLGAFGGVFIPVSLSIIGVILFFRLGWAIGEAGVLGVLSMFGIGTVLIVLTDISLAALGERTAAASPSAKLPPRPAPAAPPSSLSLPWARADGGRALLDRSDQRQDLGGRYLLPNLPVARARVRRGDRHHLLLGEPRLWAVPAPRDCAVRPI